MSNNKPLCEICGVSSGNKAVAYIFSLNLCPECWNDKKKQVKQEQNRIKKEKRIREFK